ncbi:hypothetical protein [Roseitranquillus sediminis]|uniref:hypothetical protein n=1 Tax=Roseitranquillus sediminis TaxID=2809051 RepID=UPI001D0C5084|nr:hypothetical protein [Roseitranquillus sediminis]MBM9593424.1 hypothetical protein [Roseitranquillus sediminis]
MTRWYAERRTVLGRWAPQTTPEAPHGREADHPGEVLLRTNSGPVRLRRIMRVPDHLSGRALNELRHLAANRVGW